MTGKIFFMPLFSGINDIGFQVLRWESLSGKMPREPVCCLCPFGPLWFWCLGTRVHVEKMTLTLSKSPSAQHAFC